MSHVSCIVYRIILWISHISHRVKQYSPYQYIQSIRSLSSTQISYHLVCPLLIYRSTNLVKILHRACQPYCHTLCTILEVSADEYGYYGRTRFYELSVEDGFRTDLVILLPVPVCDELRWLFSIHLALCPGIADNHREVLTAPWNLEPAGWWSPRLRVDKYIYRETFNIRRTEFQNVNVSCLVLHLILLPRMVRLILKVWQQCVLVLMPPRDLFQYVILGVLSYDLVMSRSYAIWC